MAKLEAYGLDKITLNILFVVLLSLAMTLLQEYHKDQFKTFTFAHLHKSLISSPGQMRNM